MPAPARDAGPEGLIDRYKQWLGLSTIAAAISYATLWLAYAQFYLRLGTTPEEAGIDKTDLLSQAVVGPAVFLLTVTIGIYAYALFVTIMGAFYRAQLRDLVAAGQTLLLLVRRRPVPRELKGAMSLATRARLVEAYKRHVRKSRRILYVALPLAYAVLCSLLYTESVKAAKEVERGRAVVNPSVSVGNVSLPLIGIRATGVTMHWREDPPVGFGTNQPYEQCLMHLGEADGRVLLYNVRLEELVRVSADDAIFTLDVGEHLPGECRQE